MFVLERRNSAQIDSHTQPTFRVVNRNEPHIHSNLLSSSGIFILKKIMSTSIYERKKQGGERKGENHIIETKPTVVTHILSVTPVAWYIMREEKQAVRQTMENSGFIPHEYTCHFFSH